MSGIELAGIVLAVFPLVVSAVDGCERGFGVLADWKQFRLTESEAQVITMMDEPGSPVWRTSVLTARLRDKLSGPDEFDTYCFTLKTVYAHLTKLDKRLEPHKNINKVAPGTSKINVPKEFRKLQFCFQKKKLVEQVALIGEQIDILGKLLGNAELLEPARRTRRGVMSQVFEQVRKQASSLHRAISRGWTCTCSEKHPFELLLTRNKQHGKKESTERKVERRLHVAFPFKEQDHVSMAQHSNQHETLCEPILLNGSGHAWCTTETTMFMDLAEGDESSLAGLRIDPERFDSAVSLHSGKTLTVSGSESLPRKTSVVSTDTLITDLCHKIKIREECEPFLGYLPDGLGAHHALHIVQDLAATTKGVSGIVSLRDILDGTTAQLAPISRCTRMTVALMISYGVLELHSSPWLQDKWDKSDIYFWVKEKGTVIADHPFLVSVTATEKDTSQDQRNTGALLSLGILIIELWFNQALEAQPFWAAHFGPDGKETDFTRFSAAATWQRKINEDAGVRLHSITRRCIYGDFGLDTQDLGDKNFTRAVYDGVVKELESVVAVFE